MLKEAIEHIQNTTKPHIVKLDNGHFLIVCSNGDTEEFIPLVDRPDDIHLDSLDAVVKMVKSEALPYLNGMSPLYITIPTATKVICFASPDRNDACFRQTFYTANATDVPGWESKVNLGFEEAQIAMRTRFQETTATLYLQKLLSELTMGSKVTYNDNGIATTVVTRKGVDLQNKETIKPIVKLRPYRTFQEVEQPVSEFLIRVGERGISFIEADGGMWKLQARKTVKAFLEEALADEVENQSVIVAL